MRALLISITALIVMASSAVAQTNWPTQTVRIIVPFPAGGSTDLTAREVAQGLASEFGQPFIVENRAGAGSTIGTAAVAKAPADGYTFLITSSHYSIVPALYENLPYAPLKDLKGVSLLVTLPVILVATPKLPVNSVKELIDYDRANPGKLNFGSSGAGGVNHLSGELFNAIASTKLVHVPYKGTAPAMQDLLGGHVQLMFDAISTSLPSIRSGSIKALAWTGAKRSAILPDLPTIAESGVPGYDTTSWLAMFAPANTPDDIIQKVNATVRKTLNKTDVKEKQAALGIEVVTSSPGELDQTVRTEMEKWSVLIKKLGIKVE